MHTATPWTLNTSGTIICAESLLIAHVANDALVPDHEQTANGEFIVRAVNAHDDLVAALRVAAGAMERLYSDPDASPITRHELGHVRAALASVAKEF